MTRSSIIPIISNEGDINEFCRPKSRSTDLGFIWLSLGTLTEYLFFKRRVFEHLCTNWMFIQKPREIPFGFKDHHASKNRKA